MLQNKQLLLESKNLLAFSAGGDSTALFFLLLESHIPFDIAIVNYKTRKQAEDEVRYAQELAKKYSLQCFILDSEKIDSNFEAQARNIRYDFFESLIKKHNYQTLLTAHHLGDRLEWMLMQFCKGAGCAELSGMKCLESRLNYKLIRPLLHLDKQELLAYLDANKHKYFDDESNKEMKYTRNEFRHLYTQPLLSKYLKGIKKSFQYIDEDVDELSREIHIKYFKKLVYFSSSSSKRADNIVIDKYFKSIKHLCSSSEKELLKKEVAVIISRKYIVIQEHNYIFIAPYIKTSKIPKELKEKLRLLKVHPKLRGYLASDEDAVLLVSKLLQ